MKRKWFYHTQLKVWLTHAVGTDYSAKTQRYARGTYIFFDFTNWKRVKKENFVLEYNKIMM